MNCDFNVNIYFTTLYTRFTQRKTVVDLAESIQNKEEERGSRPCK